MCSDVTIRVEDLSKAYRIYPTPSDRLKQAVMPRLRRLAAPLLRALGRSTEARPYFHEFWALRQLSFEVARGETVGIIGRNGSGKSTLLQLVCGTLTPTHGEVEVHGRVAALLELGSGFNPEYTGRQNVFLNASVLGLAQEETQARFADILAFADIGEFIDQPVKTYSSGMAMRLAFAVIAHVDADVLIIDEALAVGDAYFQQKCFRWLRGFQKKGTVLFCGHDTAALVGLCSRAIWLDRGNTRMIGSAEEVAKAYTTFIAAESMGLGEGAIRTADVAPGQAELTGPDTADMEGKAGYGSGLGRITHIALRRADGKDAPWYEGGEEAVLDLRVEALADLTDVIAGFFLKDRLGQAVAGDNSCDVALLQPQAMAQGETGLFHFRFVMPALAPGDYALGCAFASGTQDNQIQHHWIHEALMVKIQPRHHTGTMLNIQSNEKALVRGQGGAA
ncbi:MAG: hypothetical protein JWR00_2844 [Rubritepida sp.]|nr:hypothetical protein [Rubritepida sp.]